MIKSIRLTNFKMRVMYFDEENYYCEPPGIIKYAWKENEREKKREMLKTEQS